MRIINKKIQIQLYPTEEPNFDSSDDWSAIMSISVEGEDYEIHQELSEGIWAYIIINNNWYRMPTDPFWEYRDKVIDPFTLDSGDVEGSKPNTRKSL